MSNESDINPFDHPNHPDSPDHPCSCFFCAEREYKQRLEAQKQAAASEGNCDCPMCIARRQRRADTIENAIESVIRGRFGPKDDHSKNESSSAPNTRTSPPLSPYPSIAESDLAIITSAAMIASEDFRASGTPEGLNRATKVSEAVIRLSAAMMRLIASESYFSPTTPLLLEVRGREKSPSPSQFRIVDI